MSLSYLPARLVIAKDRWYILYYQTHPLTQSMVRFRETFNMNRIKSITKRRKYAKEKIKWINELLPVGFPFEEELKHLPTQTPVLKALEFATEIKIANTDRKRTIETMESIYNIFSEFIKFKKWEKKKICEFGRKESVAFLDYATIVRKVGARTHNNYIERMKSLMNELVRREYIEENPFSKMQKRKETGKTRRAFSDYERQVVGTEIKEHDKWLWLAVLLQYHCFIRPIELRRLRFYMIDLKDGLIRLSGKETKNKENVMITIPNSLLGYLRNFGFEKYNQTWLIFGVKVRPHPNKSCGHNSMNYRQTEIIKELKKKGALTDITGLTFYSWKDTGAMELFKKKVNILEIMRQLRHKDLATTQKYCQSLYVINKEIQQLDNPIIEKAF